MQTIYLDLPAGARQQLPELNGLLRPPEPQRFQAAPQTQAQAQNSIYDRISCQTQPEKVRRGYERLCLQSEQPEPLYALLETVVFEECARLILAEERDCYGAMLESDAYQRFRGQAEARLKKAEPQLRRLIRADLERLLPDGGQLNVEGYLRFSAGKLKALLQRLLEDEYDRLEQELEQEEFVALLRLFIAVQEPLLEEAHLTFYGSRFTLTDEWGNDLRQIYLDALWEEDLAAVSENDLILSILLTLLPRAIYLEIKEPPVSPEFLYLLEQVFGPQLIRQSDQS